MRLEKWIGDRHYRNQSKLTSKDNANVSKTPKQRKKPQKPCVVWHWRVHLQKDWRKGKEAS